MKRPTAAHDAIARLVSGGYIKVIITTNFDRLMEQALEAQGIIPTVISNADQLRGAAPIQHNNCTLIKLNGDYVDSRIRNTTAELEAYEPEMNALLDRVFDEYGLIISGWSGDWDTALCAAIDRCPSRRFTTYWTALSEPGDRAKQIVTNRRGETIRVESANRFFSDLAEKVTALEGMAQPHPLSLRIAVATVKRYLVEEKHKIALHDLVMGETQKLARAISDEEFPMGADLSDGDLAKRFQLYENLSGTLLALFETGCYWGDGRHTNLWTKSITQIANRPFNFKGNSYDYLRSLRRYPALLLAYGGGIAAMANDRYENLAALLLKAKAPNYQGAAATQLGIVLTPVNVLDRKMARRLPGMERNYVPLSDRLFEVMRTPLVEMLGTEENYTQAFDLFEAFFTLVLVDLENLDSSGGVYAPYGRFGWKYKREHLGPRSPLGVLKAEAETKGADWGPLKAGFFAGSLTRCQEVFGWLPEIVEHWASELW